LDVFQPEERARIDALVDEILTLRLNEGSGLSRAVVGLRDVLRTELALIHRVGPRVGGLGVDFMFGVGTPRPQTEFTGTYDEWLNGQTLRQGHAYNPIRPEPNQRNVALTFVDLRRLGQPVEDAPAVRDCFPRMGIGGWDQLRVLVCQGASLLAWVGAMQPEPMTSWQKSALRRLVPAFRQRLALERRLGTDAVREAALLAALDEVPVPALLMTRDGGVVHANDLARAAMTRGASLVAEAFAQVRGRSGATRLTIHALSARGMPTHYLIVDPAQPSDVLPRVLVAAKRWRLTPRQAQVLALLAHGHANKTIAAELACAEVSIERHVTVILRKTATHSRAEVAFKLWTEA
jgi:DNA-binding CsgD family transcriptional regulator